MRFPVYTVMLCWAQHVGRDRQENENKTAWTWKFPRRSTEFKENCLCWCIFFQQFMTIFTQCSQIFYSQVVLVMLRYLIFWWNLNLKNSRLMVLINLHSCSRFFRELIKYLHILRCLYLFFNHDLFIIRRYHNYSRNYEFLT